MVCISCGKCPDLSDYFMVCYACVYMRAVSEVRSNTQAIANIRKVLPRTCDQATRQIQALRANISHLRLQVQRARELLQSMQVKQFHHGRVFMD